MSEELAVIEPEEIRPTHRAMEAWTPRFAVTVDDAVALVEQKREFMKRVMRKDEHYGVIPGTPKPTLYKPGAELLLSSMGLHPRYRDTAPAIEDWTGTEHGGEPFFRYRKTCMITRQTGDGPNDYIVIAEAGGNCNSWEKKYRYRNAERICPVCGQPAIIRGKAEFGGGWLCFKRKNGCGEKFAQNDERITKQEQGQVPNPDIADVANTIEKMADKRALVAATLLATGCSDIFTQDLEDEEPAPPTADETFFARETARRATYPGPGSDPHIAATHVAMTRGAGEAPTPQEILERQRAKLAKPVASGDEPVPDQMVCPRCGKADALRPAGSPRFCAKANGGCGAPARGDGFTLISRAEWRERHG